MKDNIVKVAMIVIICSCFGWFVSSFSQGSPKDACTITLTQITGEDAETREAANRAIERIRTVYTSDIR